MPSDRPIITRQAWGARPPRGRFSFLTPSRVQGVVLHHSGVRNGPRGPAAVKAFERYHMDTRKWKSIAYNFLVDHDGVIYEGRGPGVVGGATKGWNSRSESICFVGWGFEPVPEKALASIKWLVENIQDRYGNKLWVKGHRDLSSSSCPGSVLYAWLQGGMPVTGVDPVVARDAAQERLEALRDAVAKRPLSRRRRSRGEAVTAVQTYLAEHGYEPGPVDGIYGRMTAAAVRRFQADTKMLKVDGVVGRNTWTRMFM